MLGFLRIARRSKDNWKGLLLISVISMLFLWNYSSISDDGKNKVPIEIASEIKVHPRNVENENEKPPKQDIQSMDVSDLENKPHPTETIAVDPVKPNNNNTPKNDKESDQETEEKYKAVTTGVRCPVQLSCKDNEFSYFVQSGHGLKEPPIICYNNELIVGNALKDTNYGRGVNLVVIHPKFKTVMDVKVFDLYESIDNCRDLAVYLSTFIEFKAQILLASFDDMTFSMCKSVQTLLNQYGSSKIKEIKFRDAFALVGERGLPGNLGKEKLMTSDGKNFPSGPANVSGCATHPMSTKYVDVSADLGYELENCGVQKCGYDEIEIHVSTASGSIRKPKLCIGSRYVFYPGLAGGRGFNIVELNPLTKTVVKQAEYDTYQVESSRLELFLENVAPGNFLIVIVSDDGSASLKQHARELLKSFGFDADLIAMRTSLYFVGKKGMKRTAIQVVHQPDNPKAWPTPINERFCLPTELVEATAQQVSNKARVDFCAKHDSFADFCYVHHKSEPLIPADTNAKYSAIPEVFDVPILVLAGVNNIALSHTLRALLQQPGLKNKKVFVAYSKMFGDDYKPFIRLFEFNFIELPPVSRYVDFLTAAFQEFWKQNPDAKHAIVIDDEIVPKTGFIWYMGHALQTMMKDNTIGAASAWNPQGFSSVALNASAVHLVADFPGQAFMITQSFYEQEIKGKEQTCCSQRSIQQWFQKGTSKPYKYIVPEVSRADYFSSTAYSAQAQPLSNMAMSMPRASPTSNFTDVPLDMSYVLNFESIVSNSLKTAYFTTEHDLTICKNKKENGAAKLLTPFIPPEKKVVGVVFSQKNEHDFTSLKTLYPCFGLMYMEGYNPFGMYNGVASLSLEDKRVYLVGTASEFYKSTVQSLNPMPFVAQF